MKYAKPEILAVAVATLAIQSLTKQSGAVETFGPPILYTTTAYEADE